MPLPRRFLLLLAIAAVFGALSVALPPATQAASFTVTKTADTNDGECSASDCSLREAIVAANAAPGPDTITLPLGGGVRTRGIFGTVTILQSVISQNSATKNGGGINAGQNATITITDSTLDGNSADDGSAIDAGGAVTLTRTTISGNSSSDDGGGVLVGVSLTAVNSTFSANSAADDGGGVIVLSGGTPALTHSTVSDNSALGGDSAGGGLRVLRGGSADLQSTIVAANPSGGDCSGSINSLGTNLDSDGSCDLQAAGDLSAANAMLGGLQDNGGPTLTHALLSGSPAIDAASPPTAPAVDQRGVLRVPAAPDAGAFERSLIDIVVTVEWAPLDPELLVQAFLQIGVNNLGPHAAGAVIIEITLPAGIRVESTPSQCPVLSEATIICELGDMLIGDSDQLAIMVTPTALGEATVSAHATAIGEEQQPADNSAEATADVQPGTVDVPLAAEWNLVGWQGTSLDVAEAAAGIAPQLAALFVFDAAGQSFQSYRPNVPSGLNSLQTLEPGQGVWLRISDPTGVVWQQTRGELLPAVQLRTGANMVVWLGEDGIDVVDAVASLGDALERLFLWDAQAQRFLSFDPSLPASLVQLNTAETLSFGTGVWLLMSQDATWDFAVP